jgi:hypothetical protein
LSLTIIPNILLQNNKNAKNTLLPTLTILEKETCFTFFAYKLIKFLPNHADVYLIYNILCGLQERILLIGELQ